MSDINSSQICLTPYEESEKTSKDKKELEAGVASPAFWPPPYTGNGVERGMDNTYGYPFSSNYMEAGAGNAGGCPPPHTVDVTNPQCQANQCQHKKGRRVSPLLLMALALLVAGCGGYQIGKKCGFWRGYRRGADDYDRRRCRDDNGHWLRPHRYNDDYDRRNGGRHDRYEGPLDWGHEHNDERYQFGGRDGGQSCEYRRRWEQEQRAPERLDVCTNMLDDRRVIEWDNHGEGYRYIQVVRDPPRENGQPRVMEAIDSNIGDAQVCMVIVDGLEEIGAYFDNFDNFMSAVNGTMSNMVDVNEFDPATAVNATFYMEPITDAAVLEQASRMLEGFCSEESEIRQLIRERDNPPHPHAPEHPHGSRCDHETRFLLPFNFEPSVGLDMNLFNMCMQERQP